MGKRVYEVAKVVRVIDGDTVVLSVDLGFSVWTEQRFRLAKINAPEKGIVGYDEATARLRELLPVGSVVSVQSLGKDRYGRWVADVFVATGSVSIILLDEDLVRPYIG